MTVMDSDMDSVRQADIYHDMGLWEKSEAIFLALIKENPEDFYAYYKLGCLQEELLEYQHASEYFQTALQLAPDDFNTLYKLAGLAMVNGDWEEAADYYRRCLEVNEGSVRVHYNLGLISYRAGKWLDAADYFSVAAELGDDFPDIWYMLGMSLKSIGRQEAAVAALGKAAKVSPDRPEIHFHLGNALMRLQRLTEAEKAFHRALTLAPHNPRYLLGMGRVCFFNGKNEEAREKLCQVLEADRKNETAQLLLNALDGQQIDQVPGALLSLMFDHCSDQFEDYMVNELKYSLPVKLREAVERACFEAEVPYAFKSVMDLGCGTGLVGELFAGCTAVLNGVDISPGMIEVARGKNIYHQLFCDDFLKMLDGTKGKHDLFLAADVFIYIGNLGKTFAAVAAHSKPGAWFAFSVERAAGVDYVLSRSGVFAHSHEYLQGLADAYGFEIALSHESGCDNFDNVMIYVLRKK